MLSVENISFSIAGKKLLDQISFSLSSGEFLAILGANGAGKTTLINCLSGLNPLDAGTVKLNGRQLAKMGRAEISQQMALVPQQQETAFSFTALEMVVMGRTPFLSTFESPSKQDIDDAEDALKVLDAGELAKSDYNCLSGGERQLVLLARALFQSQQLLLLDEPTNHLDYRNRFQILSRVKRSCTESNTAVIAILHDPNLAQLYADKVLLLERGKVLAYGSKESVMTCENISRLYGLAIAGYQVAQQEFFMPQNVLGLGLSKVMILTGESGSGKTTALLKLIEKCQQQSIQVNGIICPGVMKDGRRFNSDIQNIATGEQTLFGHRTDELDKETGTRFSFTEQGVDLGLQALDYQNLDEGQVCIIDEIGPMELRGKGFGKQVAPLLSVTNSRHIWVVRPSLIEQVIRYWSLSQVEVIAVDTANLQQELWHFVSQGSG